MYHIDKDIFRAIHESKWLSIEYKNKQGEITKYWIGIKNINCIKRTLKVDGLHVMRLTIQEFSLYLDSIIASEVVEGSYYETPVTLVEDIKFDPDKYRLIFSHAANLKILNYLAHCHQLDATPYKCDYGLIGRLDGDCLSDGSYPLREEQFKEIIGNFQISAKTSATDRKIKQICLNLLSINTKKGLYVLAYRRLNLDVKNHQLRPEPEVTICKEFTINGNKESIREFLDGDDFYLLNNFTKNQEEIKNKITEANKGIYAVDDMPYIIALERDIIIDLHGEYAAIVKMYEENKVEMPIRAFFGDLIKPPERRKIFPIALLNKKINLDQLLAINNAIKYPLTYVQGPPGTGKTNTIINTMTTAYFNDRTVLLAAYNNHPIDSVCEILQNIKYGNRTIPFPLVRLGNDKILETTIDYIKELYETTKSIPIYAQTLDRNKDDKIIRTRKLTALLEKYEDKLVLEERRKAIDKLLATNFHLTFWTELQGVQLAEVNNQLKAIGEIADKEVVALVEEDEEEFKKYLYYTSAKYIKRLSEPKNADLLKIIYVEDRKQRTKEFNKYLSKGENLKKFTRIFPIIATTCISAHKLGEPGPHFDMVIIDEASQGNTAVSLVPIIRGKNLMLVGDPQQLSPVILLNEKDNAVLRKNYSVPEEYDYIKNSVYKAFLACDAVSIEILLKHHYRCHKKIIDFNNKKYYNNKLVIKNKSGEAQPLSYVNVENNITYQKNTAPNEARHIIEYAKCNKDKKIGVITPFTNQKDYIEAMLKESGLSNATCGTVHAFQGDEKDVILFSMALTDKTGVKTYDWLKNNKELINVATSRAKEKLVLLYSEKELERLHTAAPDDADDVYELVQYVKNNGNMEVATKGAASRALGVKPYSTATEEAFLTNLNHALGNVLNTNRKCVVQREVALSQVFTSNSNHSDLFYTGRFDFVVFEKDYSKTEIPILAIELDGKEHFEDAVVKERDRKKNEICRQNGFELIRVENSYARRYYFIKDILIRYFKEVK